MKLVSNRQRILYELFITGPVVGIPLGNQHMAVEPVHLRDGKCPDGAETLAVHEISV